MSAPVVGVLQPQHGGVAPGALDGVEEQLVVVLAEHPRRVDEQVEQVGADVGGRGEVDGLGRGARAAVGRLGGGRS